MFRRSWLVTWGPLAVPSGISRELGRYLAGKLRLRFDEGLVLVRGPLVIPRRFLIGELPDHEDDEMDGDEEVRRGEPGRKSDPDFGERNGDEGGDARNGELGEDEERESGEQAEANFESQ